MKKIIEESLTCIPEIFGNGKLDDSTERFPCSICGKSYLRKRHLQRHMRDECIGIPPRFHCELCPSKFRRKYHLVRHMTSKHGINPPNPMVGMSPGGGSTAGGGMNCNLGGNAGFKNMKLENLIKDEMNMSGSENREIKHLFTNFDKFSVEALMMKQEAIAGTLSGQDSPDLSAGEIGIAQLGLQQTFQNLKNLFVNYSLNNVSN